MSFGTTNKKKVIKNQFLFLFLLVYLLNIIDVIVLIIDNKPNFNTIF